jgi:hypothetical protein
VGVLSEDAAITSTVGLPVEFVNDDLAKNVDVRRDAAIDL